MGTHPPAFATRLGRGILAAAFIGSAQLLAGPASGAAEAESPVVAKTRYESRTDLQRLGARFAHIIVDESTRTATIEATTQDLEALRRDGFALEIDPIASAKAAEAASAFATAKRIPGYACYRTVEETYATMDALATQHPSLAAVVDIGPTWSRSRDPAAGYTMKALVLGNRATDAQYPDKPSMVVTSAIHAREYTTAELMTRFGEWLVSGYGTNAEATWLMDRYRFHLVLHTNPDGRKRAEAGDLWRKNVNDTECSIGRFGVDLNRNFPFHWNFAPLGSSGDPCTEVYRGPVPGSEPETQNVVRYVAGTPGANGVYAGGVLRDRRDESVNGAAPDDYRGLYIDVHSPARMILWPWGDTLSPAPNDAGLRTLGRRLAWFNAYRPQAIQQLYFADGTTVDTIYGVLGAPSFAYEVGSAFFEDCASFEAETLPQNLESLRYAARVLDAPYRLPSGPDVVAIAASATSIDAATPLTITATLSDDRFVQSNGIEPVDVIRSAAVYVDRLPWETGAVPIAMSAVDGAFDAAEENVRATIPAGALAPGVHMLYVQGTDSRGQAGAPNAVRVTVSGASSSIASGWYWNPQESGRGFFIEERDAKVYMAAFHYAGDGRADWFVGLGRLAGASLQSPIYTFANGQTLTGPYVAPVQATSPGELRVDFASPGNVVLAWPGGTTPLVRFPFANPSRIEPPQAGAPQGGWWWYERESGRGFALEFQGDALYAAGFMYAADGTPTWYVTGGRMETPVRYRGEWMAFRNGQAMGQGYRAPVQVAGPGVARFEFSDARNGTMTLPDGRTVPLVRFEF